MPPFKPFDRMPIDLPDDHGGNYSQHRDRHALPAIAALVIFVIALIAALLKWVM